MHGSPSKPPSKLDVESPACPLFPAVFSDSPPQSRVRWSHPPQTRPVESARESPGERTCNSHSNLGIDFQQPVQNSVLAGSHLQPCFVPRVLSIFHRVRIFLRTTGTRQTWLGSSLSPCAFSARTGPRRFCASRCRRETPSPNSQCCLASLPCCGLRHPSTHRMRPPRAEAERIRPPG